MSILLPTTPGITASAPQLLDFGTVQQGALGGAAQRLNRLGNRFALTVECAPAPGDAGRIFFARLAKAVTAGAIMAFRQPWLTIGAPGAPVVNGSGQSGSVLNLRGFTAGYQAREGQFFSLIHGGRRYLHQWAADATANGAGVLSAAITPMLRVSPADGAVVEVAQPYIEGLISAEAARARISVELLFEPFSFTISEAQ
jgi:hypothetical protein